MPSDLSGSCHTHVMDRSNPCFSHSQTPAVVFEITCLLTPVAPRWCSPVTFLSKTYIRSWDPHCPKALWELHSMTCCPDSPAWHSRSSISRHQPPLQGPLPAPCHWLCPLAMSYCITPFLDTSSLAHFCLLYCCTCKNFIFSLAPSSPIQCQDSVQSLEDFYLSPIHLHSNHCHLKTCSPFNCSHIWCLDL